VSLVFLICWSKYITLFRYPDFLFFVVSGLCSGRLDTSAMAVRVEGPIVLICFCRVERRRCLQARLLTARGARMVCMNDRVTAFVWTNRGDFFVAPASCQVLRSSCRPTRESVNGVPFALAQHSCSASSAASTPSFILLATGGLSMARNAGNWLMRRVVDGNFRLIIDLTRAGDYPERTLLGEVVCCAAHGCGAREQFGIIPRQFAALSSGERRFGEGGNRNGRCRGVWTRVRPAGAVCGGFARLAAVRVYSPWSVGSLADVDGGLGDG